MTLTATLASQAPAGVPAATGTVQFQEGPTVIGTAALAGRTATLAVSNLAPGVHPIVAVYSGDANWYGLHSAALTLNISRGTTNTTLTSSATIAEVRLAATLTPAPSGGTVQFLDTAGNMALGTASLVNGTATLALTPADAARSPATPSRPSIREAPDLPAALPTRWYYPRCVTPPAGLCRNSRRTNW